MGRVQAPPVATAVLPPESQRDRWRRLRRLWKDFSSGRPEDGLGPHAIDHETGRAGLTFSLVVLFALPALVPLCMDPEVASGRWAAALGGSIGLLTAAQLEAERQARSGALLPLALGVCWASVASGAQLLVGELALPWAANHEAVAVLCHALVLAAVASRDDPRLTVATGIFSQLGLVTVWSIMALRRNQPPSGVELAASAALIAAVAALATGFALRGRRLARIAVCDPLTGLLRREAFDRCLDRELKRAERHGLPVTIALLEVDRLRDLNQASGHLFSDALLTWVASLLRDQFRTTDVIARYAGGCFAVVFLDSDNPALPRRLETVRAEVASMHLERVGLRAPLDLGLSVGVATFPREAATVESLVALAERRLAHPRLGGHGRVVAA